MKKNIIPFLLISIAFISCQRNILDKSPLNQYSTSTFFSGETEAKMALMGIYSAYDDNWYQYDFMSDNNYCQDAWQGSLEFSNWTQNSSSSRALNKWTIDYKIIGRANEFIQDIAPLSTLGDSVKLKMIGEARFLRALAYSDLVFFFGDVPLILKPQSLSEAKVTRTDKTLVMDSAYVDFDYAASVLPAVYSSTDVGRATKGAALAFKARYLLYNGKWADAAAAAKQVMDLKVYSLYPDYAAIFDESHEDNQEVIFDEQYTENTKAQPWPSFCLSFTVWPTPGCTASIIDAYYMKNGLPITNTASGYHDQDPYTNRDPRLSATFALPGSLFGTSVFIPSSDQQPTGVRPRKYASIGGDPYNDGLNFILMRYADILLMRAEGLVESGTLSQEVYSLIDQVRARVGMPSVESVEGSSLSQDSLRSVIRHERRVEFAMEATRYADMRRWKDLSTVHDVYGYDKSLLSNPVSPSTWVFKRIKLATRTFDAAKGWMWPIPLTEMQNNSKLTQNSGY